eukprot:TRINITY_DN49038_c0_g1_i1.p1 TRINITY_DN49038_c0_g1~~TRINITY_DN49038_c0_g1_i1.p1  ORF type:complete len:481 (-),score=36.62 TRINITY_DN49038_c0_g1_i1:33-1436(-)
MAAKCEHAHSPRRADLQYKQPQVAMEFRELVDAFRTDGWSGLADEFLAAVPQTQVAARRLIKSMKEGTLRRCVVLGGNGCPHDVSGVAKHFLKRYNTINSHRHFLRSRHVLERQARQMWKELQLGHFKFHRLVVNVVSTHVGKGADADAIAKAFILPLMIYTTDTAYMYELFRRMKSMRDLKEVTTASLRRCLGPYAGIAAGIVNFARLLRSAVVKHGEEARRMRKEMEGLGLRHNKLAVRAIWVDAAFSEADLPSVLQHYNFASVSCSVDGALDVLAVYGDITASRARPLLFVAPQEVIFEIGIPTGFCYERSFGGEAIADTEEEVMLPPFSFFEPVITCPLLVPMAQITDASVLEELAAAWKAPLQRVQADMADLSTTLKAGGFPRCSLCYGLTDNYPGLLRPSASRCSAEGCACVPLECNQCGEQCCRLTDLCREYRESYFPNPYEFFHSGYVVFVKKIRAQWP